MCFLCEIDLSLSLMMCVLPNCGVSESTDIFSRVFVFLEKELCHRCVCLFVCYSSISVFDVCFEGLAEVY